MAALRTAGEMVVERVPDLKLMVMSDYDIAYELRGREFDDRDGHAGAIETSRVMAIKPRLVKKRGVKNFERPPRFMVSAHPEAYFPGGVMGDATKASPAQGRRVTSGAEHSTTSGSVWRVAPSTRATISASASPLTM